MPMQSVAGRKTFRPGQPTARNTLPRGGIIHGVPAVVDNAIKPPPAPSAPGVPPIKPAYQGDAQYFTQLAQKRFDATQQEQGLDQQSAYDRTDLTEALRRRAEQHPKDAQQTNESYNRSGLCSPASCRRPAAFRSSSTSVSRPTSRARSTGASRPG
jgi:hypothetical protein